MRIQSRSGFTLLEVATVLLIIAILIVMPESWIDPSFQMSFGAVVGLVAAFEWWRERGREKDRTPPGIIGRSARATLAAGWFGCERLQM